MPTTASFAAAILADQVWRENAGGSRWFRRAVTEREKVSGRAAAEKCCDTENIEHACEKARVELEQVKKI